MGESAFLQFLAKIYSLTVGQGILRAVGVGGGAAAAGVVETGDLIDLWKSFAENVGFG